MKSCFLQFERPTSHYIVGDTINALILPALDCEYEVKLYPLPSSLHASNLILNGNKIIIKAELPPGTFYLRARSRLTNLAHGLSSWTEWSSPLSFQVHCSDDNLWPLWIHDHKFSLSLERSIDNSYTLIDPDFIPPNAENINSSELKWFPTYVFEGATPLFNEDSDYYKDPFVYYFTCIDYLLSMGAKFITWDDVIAGSTNSAPLEILLQFDIDAGLMSMRRIYEGLRSRGIKATVMTHFTGHYWYSYDLSCDDIAWMKDAESNNWCIGYHNNSLSQVIGNSSDPIDGSALKLASKVFSDDVNSLRKHFSVNTYTNHGGNVRNNLVVAPSSLDVKGVDRYVSPEFWNGIDSMFSDGGFLSRPASLRQKVSSITNGTHFFRNHPFKYANYSLTGDVGPKAKHLAPSMYGTQSKISNDYLPGSSKESLWLQHRKEVKSSLHQSLSYLRINKPISSGFLNSQPTEFQINRLRSLRRDSFLKLYPYQEGDPRVFWWRMINAWAPKSGLILNVGALPPSQKDENLSFLSPNISLVDMDIDGSREPDYVMDICNVPTMFSNKFSGIMLFGFPYFSSPSQAISSCLEVTKPGGVGLFGFASDTHPARGSIFHPSTRHTWCIEAEPLVDIGLKANLWAFSGNNLDQLFIGWTHLKIEFMGHYWFVVAQKL